MAFGLFRKKKKLDADAFCEKFEGFYDETLEITPATLNQPATLQEEFLINSNLDYLNSQKNNFAYDARNFDIVSDPQGKILYTKWFKNKEILNFMMEEDKSIYGTKLLDKHVDKVAKNIVDIQTIMEEKFGRKVYSSPASNFVFFAKNKNGIKKRDYRNTISCGKEESLFKKFFIENEINLQEGDKEPTILQIDILNDEFQKPFFVSSTFAVAFLEGCIDVVHAYANYANHNLPNCTVHFIAGEDENRQHISQSFDNAVNASQFIAEYCEKLVNGFSPEEDLDKSL